MPTRSKPAQRAVVRGHFALALQNVDGNRALAIGRGRENLALFDRDGGVALNDAWS